VQYKVEEINNNVAKIQFSDGTWTFLELNADLTEADLDDMVYAIAPPHLKTGTGTPSFLSSGQSRTAAAKPIEEAEEGGE
tara:strand:+ start:528 stop:767 length:240 start_codon:yes stop_codon:yes gene_type:complete